MADRNSLDDILRAHDSRAQRKGEQRAQARVAAEMVVNPWRHILQPLIVEANTKLKKYNVMLNEPQSSFGMEGAAGAHLTVQGAIYKDFGWRPIAELRLEVTEEAEIAVTYESIPVETVAFASWPDTSEPTKEKLQSLLNGFIARLLELKEDGVF